jgi:5-methylcytosine-specific restriction protein A
MIACVEWCSPARHVVNGLSRRAGLDASLVRTIPAERIGSRRTESVYWAAKRMRTFLLSWNPNQWRWDYLHDSIRHVTSQGFSDDHWSCGNRRDIDMGDRFFLIRLGKNPRGIVASGFVTSPAFDGPHWDEDRAVDGDTSIYVNVRFDAITENPTIPIAELDQPPMESVHWHSQSSGTQIEAAVAAAVEELWRSRVAIQPISLAAQLPDSRPLTEGTRRQVVTTAFERSEGARRKCLEHYGYACACCGIVLAKVYGPIANDFIHVHHRVPLSDIGESHSVDPINDLVPVCPTCHAIIHLNDPALSVQAVKELLASHAGRKT